MTEKGNNILATMINEKNKILPICVFLVMIFISSTNSLGKYSYLTFSNADSKTSKYMTMASKNLVNDNQTIKYQSTSEKNVNPLECSITIENLTWDRSTQPFINLTIKNISQNDISCVTLPVLYIYGKKNTLIEKDTCSFQILGRHFRGMSVKKPSVLSKVVLSKQQSTNIKIDLNAIEWGAASSILPSREFFKVIPSGRYKLFLTIRYQTEGSSKDNCIRSNEVLIKISNKGCKFC